MFNEAEWLKNEVKFEGELKSRTNQVIFLTAKSGYLSLTCPAEQNINKN
jgi:hypothetical protein